MAEMFKVSTEALGALLIPGRKLNPVLRERAILRHRHRRWRCCSNARST